MCGIYGVICPKAYQSKIGSKIYLPEYRLRHKLLRHRGPDWEGDFERPDYYMAHHRLSIVDPVGGSQPITYDLAKLQKTDDYKYSLCVNGEIYNHSELKEQVKTALKTPVVPNVSICASVDMCEQQDRIPSEWYPYPEYKYKTGSDCEVILSLYDRAMSFIPSEYGDNVGEKVDMTPKRWDRYDLIIRRLSDSIKQINGIFAFILADEARGYYLIARDHIGVIPLYYGYDENGYISFASEMKAFGPDVIPHNFPPGHFMLIHNADIGSTRPKVHKYYTDLDMDPLKVRQLSTEDDLDINSPVIQDYMCRVRETLIKAVEGQLMADVPFGALLSGGLDSSLVCAIACKAISRNQASDGALGGWCNKLQTFSIGLEGGSATDLEAAAKAAQWLGTQHHNFTFTINEGLAAVRDVIWHLETYDVTTIRASIPMYLLARKIKAMGIKMVLSGEGSDEIFGGYLYFLQAPNDLEHTKECIRRVSQLSLFDCLRANKSTMAWGLEARPPFLDTELVKLGLEMPSALKKLKRDGRPVEKWILRAAFDVRDPITNQPIYLPDDLLWRQKEQFSDGVGYGWIDRLKTEAETRVSDYILSLASERFPVNTPKTKEEYRYRMLFEELFPYRGWEYTVEKWVPKIEWSGVGYDPSGRAQIAHQATYEAET